jgi:GalNAc5-diNAcBac-PP-undecaprenol beta-1,3-glucosyltransferase
MQNSESTPDMYTTSVVIISHNRPDYLTMALEGITKQKHLPDEVIIIDEFSNVDYSNVLEKCIELPVQYLKLNESSGANKARNTGVKLALSYLCFAP